KVVPLPIGESAVSIYMVTSDNVWNQIAGFTLHVEDPGSQQPVSQAQPPAATQKNGGPAPSASTQNGAAGGAPVRKGVFDRATFNPSITLGLKSQAAESNFPDSNRPPRTTFADMTFQGSFRSDIARGQFNSQTQFNIVGSSFEKEALRF